MAKALSTIERFKGHPLLQFALSPHAPYTVCDENLLRTWKEAQRLGLPMHTHLHETEMETLHSEAGEESMARHRSDQLCRPLANFKRMGITGPRLIGAHMAHLVDAEVEMLAHDGAHIVHCPESNMKLVAGFCPVHKLLKAGANVALGTDSACSNNDLSMLGEMRTAALVGKVVAGTGNALSGGTALRMATINGARAAGQADVFGSLEVGKSADMIAVELKGPQHRPIYHVLTHLTYNAEANAVTDVWVAGKRLLRDRQLTTINEEELMRKVDAWQAIIADQSASVPEHLYH